MTAHSEDGDETSSRPGSRPSALLRAAVEEADGRPVRPRDAVDTIGAGPVGRPARRRSALLVTYEPEQFPGVPAVPDLVDRA